MRYLTIILLFVCLSAKGECFQTINGERVPCTQEYLAQRQLDSIAVVRDSSDNNKKDRAERQIANRNKYLLKAMIYMSVKLNDTQYSNFVTSTRNERNDFPYVPDGLILWVNTTFTTKNYFTPEIQARLLRILNGQD